jgi:hypothetical protein
MLGALPHSATLRNVKGRKIGGEGSCHPKCPVYKELTDFVVPLQCELAADEYLAFVFSQSA